MGKAWQHFCTITHHKLLVMRECFKLGLYRQGLLHDLSKYGWTEFRVGAKYYQGTRSPNNAEREEKGYSSAWLHHKGRNKHHYEYWMDYGMNGERGLVGMRMPRRYVAEMFVDRVAACKIYMKDGYTEHAPLDYFRSGTDYGLMMHEETRALLEKLLVMLAQSGERETYRYIREQVLSEKEKETQK